MPAIGQADAARLLSRVNLNHLVYFWAVAQAGSVSAAARRLGVAQPSVSEQVKRLESRLGAPLFDRGPRGITLTAAGTHAMRFAEEIVGTCSDLLGALPLRAPFTDRPLIVGTADAVPKVVVRTILEPLLTSDPPTHVICREWHVDHLLAELSLHRLDLVIADAPTTEGAVPARSLPAISSAVDLYAAPPLLARARRLLRDAPERVPFLLPTQGAALRTHLDRWFALRRIEPTIIAEAEDRSLLHHFAERALGVVPVASVTGPDIARQFGLRRVSRFTGVHEQYFAIMIDRRHSHPGLAVIRARLSARAEPGRSRKRR
jgi:LysR family transcriptional activator of nhaA